MGKEIDIFSERAQFNEAWDAVQPLEGSKKSVDWRDLLRRDWDLLAGIGYDGDMDVVADLLERIMKSSREIYGDQLARARSVAEAAKFAKDLTNERTQNGFPNDRRLVALISVAQQRSYTDSKKVISSNPQGAYEVLGTIEEGLSSDSEILFEVLAGMRRALAAKVNKNKNAACSELGRYWDLVERIGARKNSKFFELLSSVAGDAANVAGSQSKFIVVRERRKKPFVRGRGDGVDAALQEGAMR